MNSKEIVHSVSEIIDVKERINSLFEKGHALMNKEPLVGIELSEYILNESKQYGYAEGEALGFNLKALCNTVLGNHEVAIRCFSSALTSANKSVLDLTHEVKYLKMQINTTNNQINSRQY